jgi:hypothetical protein
MTLAAAPHPLAGLLPDLFGRRDDGDARNTLERDAPGTLRFDGLLAGLFGRTGSGDRNDAANYTLFCPNCGTVLGVLARWRPWRDGTRAVRCTFQNEEGSCDVVTVLDKGARILRVAPGAAYDAWMATVMAKQAHERARERAEQERRQDETERVEW